MAITKLQRKTINLWDKQNPGYKSKDVANILGIREHKIKQIRIDTNKKETERNLRKAVEAAEHHRLKRKRWDNIRLKDMRCEIW